MKRYGLLPLILAFSLLLAAPVYALRDQDPPAVAAFSKNGSLRQGISFSTADFQVTGKTALSSILVDTLPDPNAGLLTVGGQAVPQGSEISMTAVDGLRFTPLASPMLAATDFTFTPVFASGQTGEAVTVGLFLLSSPNSPPVAQDLSLSTYRNVEVRGKLAGVDPEGDILTFRLVSKPARGAVALQEDGSFVYTPYENKTGKDAFTYVAVDAVGNTSQPATVKVKIEKQKTQVFYPDMAGVEGHREALRLAEAGVLTGEKMGQVYLFHPQETVSRAQFTALALAVSGRDEGGSASFTGFADDEAMASWVKPYVSAALRSGTVQGSVDGEGRVVFRADDPITAAEAAVVVDRALSLTDAVGVFGAEEGLWYSQAAANLDSCAALPPSAVLREPLTRAQAAVMLSAALDVMETREAGSWFPWG